MGSKSIPIILNEVRNSVQMEKATLLPSDDKINCTFLYSSTQPGFRSRSRPETGYLAGAGAVTLVRLQLHLKYFCFLGAGAAPKKPAGSETLRPIIKTSIIDSRTWKLGWLMKEAVWKGLNNVSRGLLSPHPPKKTKREKTEQKSQYR